MIAIIISNLFRRRARTLLTALGVGVGVAMMVGLLSLSQGIKDSAAELIHLGGSDLGLFQAGASDPTASVLPESLAERLKRSPEITAATPVLLLVEAVKQQPSAVLFGVQPGSFFMRNMVYLEGGPPRGAELAVGEVLAKELHLTLGSHLAVDGRQLPVVGIYRTGILYEDSGGALELHFAQTLAGRTGEATLFAVELGPGVKAEVAGKRLEKELPGITAITTPEQAARAGANGALIGNATDVIIVVALIVGGISVTNTMVMATIERQGELALLATVGWTPLQVGALIVGEGVAVSMLGAAVGLLLGVLGSKGLVLSLGVGRLVSPSVTAWGLGKGLLVGIAIGVLGGIYPAWRAVRMPPLKGLARV